MNTARPRWPRPTLRARLTLLYGGLFLAGAISVLAITWLLLRQRLDTDTTTFTVPVPNPGPPADRPVIAYANGRALDATDLPGWVAAQQNQVRETALTSLLTQGGLVLAGVGVVAVGLGWLLAGRALAPLHRVTDTARRIVGAPAVDHGLRQRIALAGPPDEVKDLADTFDSMLDRLDRSFDSQRRFVANASHELRTPLAASRGVVELALRRHRHTPEFVDVGETLLDINTRQEQLIDGLLLLARSETDISTRHPVDLAALLRKVVALNSAEATAAGVTLHTTPDHTTTTGDPTLIERIVHNLIQNAIRHNLPKHGWVHASTRQRPDGTAELIVTNTGRSIADHEIPQLFEPFSRGTTDRLATTHGAGLGLSIVRSITTAHGGTTTAHPHNGGGLTIHITLPHHTTNP